MKSKENEGGKSMKCGGKCSSGACGGAVYGLGFVGAVVYYIASASGFWMGVLGFFKAIVWPAFVVFEVLKYVGA